MLLWWQVWDSQSNVAEVLNCVEYGAMSLGKWFLMFQRIVMPSSAESGSLIKHNSITKIAISSESILAYRSEYLTETIWPRFWPILPCFHFGTKAYEMEAMRVILEYLGTLQNWQGILPFSIQYHVCPLCSVILIMPNISLDDSRLIFLVTTGVTKME